METNKFAKIGASLFILWGIIHVLGGGAMLVAAFAESPFEVLRMMSSTASEADLNAVPGGIINAVIQFHSFNILWMGMLAIVIGAFLNWKNSRIGFWVNLSVIGLADLGLYLFLIQPGYMAWTDGFIGPLLFLLGAISSFYGLRIRDRQEVASQKIRESIA